MGPGCVSRFYVLRELDIGPDGNWTDAGFKSRYGARSWRTALGNLVNRSLSMLKRYRNGIVPKPSNELASNAEKAVNDTRVSLEQNQLQGALENIWVLVNRANKYVEETAPFKLAKDRFRRNGWMTFFTISWNRVVCSRYCFRHSCRIPARRFTPNSV